MSRLDHITINVSDYVASRDWYANNFGLRVEFEDLNAGFGGLEDDGNTELILVQTVMQDRARDCSLSFQCESVHAKHADLSARGIQFVHEPKNVPWGYGTELLDPDGYRVLLWDKATMPGYKDR
ncbi:MAG: VOC family protein [Acidobacteriia bacterium]|nr:VOC family protein [Terriglobia bacterium]